MMALTLLFLMLAMTLLFSLTSVVHILLCLAKPDMFAYSPRLLTNMRFRQIVPPICSAGNHLICSG